MVAIIRARLAATAAGDGGSILPLTLGYGVLALVLVLVCADATSLYLQQKRLDSVADAAALAGADGFAFDVVGGAPVATLTDEGVRQQAEALLAESGTAAVLVDAGTPDGTSARVTIAGTWHPPVLTLFVPDGLALEATATSRSALR
ncbi:pilus assembly protein TadG-related protein [Microbacterium sp. BWT-B31]|uniref:pilus assembly protein TadG-related protein n=1 Tax=Microbacterium sp. BWT-B31 TaxID=3232072 RepID=UPI003528F045